MTSRFLPLLCVVPAVLLAGCEGGSLRDCSTEDISAAIALPDRLSQTGLYADIGTQTLSASALEFTPQFPLWTDGAKKRRWLVLPEGGVVDTRDAEHWVFPEGTQFFKEFTRDGVRIETRMNQKGATGWGAVAYVWTPEGDEALPQLETLEDAAGTPHDVPGAAECLACHAGRGDFSLGFSATQLDRDTRIALHEAGVLSDPVEGALNLEEDLRAGLGVLHGNCSHCHNSARNDLAQSTECYSLYDNFDLSLPHDLSDITAAPALQTARWQLGDPDDSEVLDRMSTRNLSERTPSMPPLGTEQVDDEGVAAVEAFLRALAAGGH